MIRCIIRCTFHVNRDGKKYLKNTYSTSCCMNSTSPYSEFSCTKHPYSVVSYMAGMDVRNCQSPRVVKSPHTCSAVHLSCVPKVGKCVSYVLTPRILQQLVNIYAWSLHPQKLQSYGSFVNTSFKRNWKHKS